MMLSRKGISLKKYFTNFGISLARYFTKKWHFTKSNMTVYIIGITTFFDHRIDWLDEKVCNNFKYTKPFFSENKNFDRF